MTPTELRLRLLAAGYSPLPLYGKVPPLKEWSQQFDTSPAEIEIWGRMWSGAGNTGLLTRRVPTIDVDVPNPEAAEACKALVCERFDGRGYVMARTGMAPKFCIPFRCDRPFDKILRPLIGPDGSKGGQFEFLADGQQFAAFGVHPQTQRAYTWHGGEPGQVARNDLPEIDGEAALQLVDGDLLPLVEQFGFTLAPKKAKPKTNYDTAQVIVNPDSAGAARYAQAALEREVEALAALSKGEHRNIALNNAAVKLFGLVATGVLAADVVEAALLDACDRNGYIKDDGIKAARATLESGAAYGLSRPRAIPALVVAYPEQRPGPDPFSNGFDIDPPANQSADPQPEPERVGKTWSKRERKRDQEPPPPEPPAEPPDEPPPDPRRDPDEPVTLADFRSYALKRATYIYITGELWPDRSVNARIAPIPLVDAHGEPVLNAKGRPIKLSAAAWLDRYRQVAQMTWAPGLPKLINDRLIIQAGWIDHPGAVVYNLYRPPTLVPKPGNVQPWLDHVHRLYPEDDQHIIKWLAHRKQRPHEKINHALVLGGFMRIGKDTVLVPVKHAVGPWNCADISPQKLVGRFQPFLQSVILTINEARDLGDNGKLDRFAFYDHSKNIIAAPPDVLRIDDKNIREYTIPNLCGVIIVTNHLTDGIYLPEDDGRHFVAWSEVKKEDFADDYFPSIYKYYEEQGGIAAVAYYLQNLDLTGFDPKAPPPRTQAFWTIVNASRTPEDAELADVLDRLGNPAAVTLLRVQNKAGEGISDEEERKGHYFVTWLKDRRNARKVGHRFERCGYVPVRNNAAKDNLWVIHGRRQVIYAKATLTLAQRLAAADELVTATGTKPPPDRDLADLMSREPRYE